MPTTTTIEVPLGQHTARCTLEIPEKAAGTHLDEVELATLAMNIASALQRSTGTQDPSKPNDDVTAPGAEVDAGEVSEVERLGRAYERLDIDEDEDGEQQQEEVYEQYTEMPAPQADGHLRIQLRDTIGNNWVVRIAPYTQFGHIFNAYATLMGMPGDAFSFVLRGLPVYPLNTPAMWAMVDGEVVFVMLRSGGK